MSQRPCPRIQGSWWFPAPHTICFENYLNQRAEGVLDVEDVMKRAADSMSAIPGSKIKITGVYEF